MARLNKLRQKNVPLFKKIRDNVFEQPKFEVIKATRLIHYSDELPLILAVDAFSYEISAILLHRMVDGSERPMAHVSKTLNNCQSKYSQIEEKALAIIFGVQRFHQYVFGRKFELVTDHKPLISIFAPNKQLPIGTANRLQRSAIILIGYNYTIRYK